MSTPNMNDPNEVPTNGVYEAPVVPVTYGEGIAERFVRKELADARKSLRMAQIGGSILAVATAAYFGFLTSSLNRTLEPKAAAQVATGLIVDQVESQGPQIASEIKTRVPGLIEQLPDYALKQLPQYRTALENQVESDMQTSFASSSKQLGETFDELLDGNKEDIQKMLKDGKDPEASAEIGKAMESEMIDFVKTAKVGDEPMSAKLDEALVSLNHVDKRMARLAANQNLTPQEKKARRAIGILSRNIDMTGKKMGMTL